VNHFASPEFWQAYQELPADIRKLADRSFQQLKENPRRPSLNLKPAGKYWSVRVGLHYRALGVRRQDDLIWFWIGSHAEYDTLIKR